MDSLTQIVLGAAVGEAVLGKKIGNRAMVWGAIGGTIPDLDVMANLFMGELDAMSAHRGITHSMFFAVLAPLAFAWLLSFLYRSGAYRKLPYKAAIALINTVVLLFIVWGVYRASESLYGLAIAGGFTLYLLWRLYRFYLTKEQSEVDASFREWYLLFVLAFATHFLLDCFTAYGTQIFQPFSNHRVAFNTISVVDPLYTLPFLICTVVAAFLKKGSNARLAWNWVGIGISSTYLLFTVFNHARVDTIFQRALDSRGFFAERQSVNPSILQNVLWNCVAESDNAYYLGLYSMFDSDQNMHWINVLPKDTAAIRRLEPSEEYQTLEWFSNGYLQVVDQDSLYELFDLRFGAMSDTVVDGSEFVFKFVLKPDGDQLHFSQVQAEQEDFGEAWRQFKTRVKGR